ncbi:SymE family type I addiction module toxin [Lonsdalea quercina]|uniref:SymE family type I addiction module toxin n=1 Tax=Lonsdalea quercina TaxID=71657 RepID=UPI00397606EC
MPGRRSPRHTDRNDMTRYYRRSPSLYLKGHWLQEAGFETGQPVHVTVEHG